MMKFVDFLQSLLERAGPESLFVAEPLKTIFRSQSHTLNDEDLHAGAKIEQTDIQFTGGSEKQPLKKRMAFPVP